MKASHADITLANAMTLGAKGNTYVLAVSAAGVYVLFDCITEVLRQPIASEWLLLAALTLLSGSFTIKVPQLAARLSVSETFVFASVLLFGTCAGTITVALDVFVASLRFVDRFKEPSKVFFNLSAATVSIWVSGHAFYYFAGVQPLSEQSVTLPHLLIPLILLAALYFLLNSFFIAVVLSLERHVGAFGIWKTHFLWLSVNYFGGASVAALLVSYTQTVDIAALGIIVPLLIISYLTFKTSLGRIEDASRHVNELNRLYMSTIETLATAIDAKDQVTHGHIRRVQRLTSALARHLGVADENQLKALEAASLLHDTGKLVVPEHILNKPGRLTPGEFDKLKLHANAGADILSAITFPYPVVPIVRHHHENWDGTGYPDGLKGTDIPIGARILAVVDCYDALTSDRPYRRSMSHNDALTIIMQRRGTMYDPLIVDTFVRVTDHILVQNVDSTPLKPFAVSVERDIPNHDDDCLGIIATVLRTITDATGAAMVVMFVVDRRTDKAVSLLALRNGSKLPQRISMPVGSGVSGWVIANNRPIVNSDSALDLRDTVPVLTVSRCASIPLVLNGEAVGALSCYIDDIRGFSDRDVAFMENIALTFTKEPLDHVIRRVTLSHRHDSRAQSVH